MIELNITLLIQLANFIVALLLANYLLIRPIRRIIASRKGVVQGLLTETQRFAAQAADRLNNYEATLAKAREDSVASFETVKAEADKSGHGLVTEAQTEAQVFLQGARREIEAEIQTAIKTLHAEVPQLAGKAVAQVLK